MWVKVQTQLEPPFIHPALLYKDKKDNWPKIYSPFQIYGGLNKYGPPRTIENGTMGRHSLVEVGMDLLKEVCH